MLSRRRSSACSFVLVRSSVPLFVGSSVRPFVCLFTFRSLVRQLFT